MNVHPIDSIGVLYVEVPKAAATSIKLTLAPYRRGGRIPKEPRALHRWFGYTYASDENELDRWIVSNWSGYFRFAVVRHPLERFESLFYDKVNQGSIEDFAFGFEATKWAGDCHGERQVELIGRNLGKYDFVGRVEDVGSIEVALGTVLGCEARLPRANTSKRGPVLSGEAREHVLEHYREDFEVLGYEP